MAEILKLFYIWFFYVLLFVTTSHAVERYKLLPYECEVDEDCPRYIHHPQIMKCINLFCRIVYQD
uniref:Nodule-specific cysteine-rich peptide G39 n=1 Tax=Pisum sativum TaxID=3888 RepID=Q9AVA1_PEA|nr:nodule-specific cysteine-rich peptide G39 [Pisum sativum]BAB40945.1 nodule-specific protein [Pisum sativum]